MTPEDHAAIALLKEQLAQMEKRVVRLAAKIESESRLAEAQKDTERLDWLSVVRAGSWYPFANEQGEWWIVHRATPKLSVGPEPTLRAAIDAARGKP